MMDDRSKAHETVVWAKQRLDEIDAIILQVEKTVQKLSDDARARAEAVLVRLRASRARVEARYDQLRAEADSVKSGIDQAREALDTEWVEVETAFQDFLAEVKDQAGGAREAILARVVAQRRSWEAAIAGLRRQAGTIVEKARTDFRGAMKQISDEAEKFQARIGDARTDLAARRAILEAGIEARQKDWQDLIDDLREDAAKLAADQRAAVDARVAALKAQADEARARAAQPQSASAEGWETTRQSYAEAQKLVFDTYASIRQTLEDAARK